MWGDRISKAELEKCHVLFQKEDRDTYVERLLTAVLVPPAGLKLHEHPAL